MAVISGLLIAHWLLSCAKVHQAPPKQNLFHRTRKNETKRFHWLHYFQREMFRYVSQNLRTFLLNEVNVKRKTWGGEEERKKIDRIKAQDGGDKWT
jgi:hypothetical protein